MNMFTATKLQAATYLLGVCLFSIAFLVFLNSSVSFVITNLIGQRTKVGDAVGTLGFADELVALVACPAWGVMSDRLGVRMVCVLGYTIIGLALVLFVQAKDVFPQLLLARLFFSIGGAAASTMVTAILPSMIAPREHNDVANLPNKPPGPSNGHGVSPSVSSELTITPQRLQNQSSPRTPLNELSPTRLAGIVGIFTGCGALLALGLFLRLPELIQRRGTSPGQALADSYYIIGAMSLVLALLCFLGLRNLQGEDEKGWRNLIYGGPDDPPSKISSLKSLAEAVALGFRNPLLGLGYLGGFVARASSVAISLFIPLFVNAYYISSGLCDETGHNPQDVKTHCREAYVLAAELTGVSQLVALLFAPVFGFLADRYRRFNIPLLTAALIGLVGYIGLAFLASPQAKGTHGTPWIFVIMALLGISQIGAIVCSLGLLGRGVLGLQADSDLPGPLSSDLMARAEVHNSNSNDTAASTDPPSEDNAEEAAEGTPLLRGRDCSQNHLKGSIAGVYSLAGGVGILLLTKVGGLLFDNVSPVAPFVMISAFNFLLLAAGIASGISVVWKGK